MLDPDEGLPVCFVNLLFLRERFYPGRKALGKQDLEGSVIFRSSFPKQVGAVSLSRMHLYPGTGQGNGQSILGGAQSLPFHESRLFEHYGGQPL